MLKHVCKCHKYHNTVLCFAEECMFTLSKRTNSLRGSKQNLNFLQLKHQENEVTSVYQMQSLYIWYTSTTDIKDILREGD